MYKFLLALGLLMFPALNCVAQVDSTAQVDTLIGLNVGGKESKDHKELAHMLCSGLKGDRPKANAIYNWITHHIKCDIAAIQSGKLKPEKIEKVLKNHLGVCEGYAKLFTAMCQEAGLKAVSIEGYAKDWIFDNGDQLTLPRHMWSAVLLDSQWQLVDPTWGAGVLVQSPTVIRKIINKVTFRKVVYAKKLKFVYRYDPQYFNQDAEAFRLKHLPADPYWQLTDTAMPLSVFEAGDSAVILFNKEYSKPQQNTPELARIAALKPDSVAFDAAERSYNFNSRFPVALAIQQAAKVQDNLKKIEDEADIEKAKALFKDATKAMKIAEEHIKEQKKFFPEQYNILKKKNRAKNGEAKQYMNQIKTDDKKLVAQCVKYRNGAATKIKKVNKKYADASRRKQTTDPNKLRDIEPSKTQKTALAPELVEIKDSIRERNERIDSLQTDVAARTVAIKALMDSNMTRLDSLGKCLATSDSFLVMEAKARIGMHDNYDDEVIKWSTLFKEKKYNRADTLHRDYITHYDTILMQSDERYKVNLMALDAFKKNLKDAEKYAKWNSDDTLVHNSYGTMVSKYQAAIDSCNQDLLYTAAYIKAHKALFIGLTKLYKRQLTIVQYMARVEDVRKKLEYNTIMSKQALDNNENKQQIANVKSAIKQMERVLQ